MENENQNADQNFFEKFGLEVSSGEVEIGQTYPNLIIPPNSLAMHQAAL